MPLSPQVRSSHYSSLLVVYSPLVVWSGAVTCTRHCGITQRILTALNSLCAPPIHPCLPLLPPQALATADLFTVSTFCLFQDAIQWEPQSVELFRLASLAVVIPM